MPLPISAMAREIADCEARKAIIVRLKEECRGGQNTHHNRTLRRAPNLDSIPGHLIDEAFRAAGL